VAVEGQEIFWIFLKGEGGAELLRGQGRTMSCGDGGRLRDFLGLPGGREMLSCSGSRYSSCLVVGSCP